MGLNSLQFLVNSIINVYCFVLILRAWCQFCRLDFYSSLSQTVVKLTQPIISPLQKIIPTIGNVNLASILLVVVLGAIKYPLMNLLGSAQVIMEPVAFIMLGILHTVRTIGEIVLYVIFIMAISSWFSRGQTNFQYTLYQLTQPLLNPIRKILPNTGMIDFAPMLLAFILFYGNRVLYDIFSLWVLA